LIKRSKKFNDPNKAPYNDRWLLRDGSKRQPSVTAWAARNDFTRLDQITAGAMDRWRNTWVFREESYSMKIQQRRHQSVFSVGGEVWLLGKQSLRPIKETSSEEN
jgi:hypothetical protein